MPAPTDRLYFLHIPKTAGTSLTEWLRRYFPDDQFCPLFTVEEIAKLDHSRLNQYRLFAGHMGWDLLQHLDFRPVVASWFRDPVERVISSYWYLRNLDPAAIVDVGHEASRKQAEMARKLSLEDWIELPAAEYFIHNHMTWTMAGSEGDPNAPISSALRNLQRLDMIGIVEEMNASLALLTARMGWMPSFLGPRHNAAARPEGETEKKVRRRIEQLNWMDRALYQTARALFSERYRELTLSLGLGTPSELSPEDPQAPEGRPDGKIDQYALFFAQEWVVLRKEWKGERLQTGVVSVAAPYFHTGWFPPVPCPRVPGNLLRWTTHQIASRLYLPLATSRDLQLQFLVGEFADEELFQHVGVLVNNRSLLVDIQPAASAEYPHAHRLVVTVPRDLLQESPNVARVNFKDLRSIRVPNAYRFIALGEEVPLGLGLLEINIVPVPARSRPSAARRSSLRR